jgi:TRAP-type C4-dicarboxylate transport system permease small subunit
LKAFFRSLEKTMNLLEWMSSLASGWMIVLLMVLSTSDVAFRLVARNSIEGAYSLSEIVMVGICFFAMSYTQREKGHVSMDFLVMRLSGRKLRFAEITSSFLSLFVSVLLFYRATVEAVGAVELKLVTSGIIEWPAWPLKIVVAFGFFLLCIRIFIQLVHAFAYMPENTTNAIG